MSVVMSSEIQAKMVAGTRIGLQGQATCSKCR